MGELALQRRLTDVIEEYDRKKAAISEALASFEKAGSFLRESACVGATWGNVSIDTGSVYERTLESSLLRSAWLCIYNGLHIKRIASAKDKRLFEQAMENPPEFTLENIRATFGDFVADPYGNILRGLAEVFCDLDPAYKSHDKVKIGVHGLPKRIILTNVSGYGSWGRDRLENVLNALAQYQQKPLITYHEIRRLLENEDALLNDGEIETGSKYSSEKVKIVGRGVRLKRFQNGNGHLFFEPETLRDINRALAEYYGEVLADCSDDEPKQKRAGTAVSKDLQYYPTPKAVVERIIENLYPIKGHRVLEPSCGCGRFMDALREAGAKPYGIEVDPGRAEECRAKGHSVLISNFLETVPTGNYDRVVMNPPFYGKHYAKHVNHALKFLKNDGVLTAILPVTARYDHGLLDGHWEDLPVGSFQESGTNINTTVLTISRGGA